MTEKVLQHLLHLRQNIFISGLGRFSLEMVPAELQPGSALIQAPAFLPEFQTRPAGRQNSLAEALQEVYGISVEKAAEMEKSFAAGILKSLEENRRHELPGFGVLLAGYDASLQFVPEKTRIQSASHFGLRAVSARQLLVRHQLPSEKEAPVIPLQPFEKTGNEGKRPFRLLAYAASGIGIALAAGTLIWLNSLTPPQGQQAGILPVSKSEQKMATPAVVAESKPAAAAIQENLQQVPEKATVQQENDQVPVVSPEPVKAAEVLPISKEAAPQKSELSGNVAKDASANRSGHRRRHHRKAVQEMKEKEESKDLIANIPSADAAGFRFHVVAGSFKRSGSAKTAERIWRRSGYKTGRHLLAEKEMIRVSIGSFATKEEAEIFRDGHRPDFSSALWILEGE